MRFFLIPWIDSYKLHNYLLGNASTNILAKYYKIPHQSISFKRLLSCKITCKYNNYIFGREEGEFIRKLPLPFSNSYKRDTNWINTRGNEYYLESNGARLFKNTVTKDSFKIYFDDWITEPNFTEFTNGSDTSIMIITNCNWKRSEYSELGVIYVWPKINVL
ncbi:MAG TPA: hypothetical protein PLD02_12525 [Saprospiraceae bacterium]|nr:hypothetical protein [Saprospiraceae bacterium]